MGMAFPCTCTPLSDVHARIGIDSRRFVFKIRLQGAIASAMSSRPSIVPPGLENRRLSSAAASATRQPCSRNGDGSEAGHSRLVSLHDEVMAAALLDRLLHRCHIVNRQ